MMIHMITVGGVTADIEGKESANGATYLSFDLAVTKGYGTSRHTVYLQVWAFRAIAERLIAAKVKKGSQLLISGDFDVVTFERKDGSKGTVNKVILQDWEFVGGSKNNEDEAEGKKSQPKVTYQEHYCTDDDELPL